MPIYIDIFSLVLDKKIIAQKYHGGIHQFRIDYHIPESEINEEDDELFALGQMNADEFDIDALVAKGLSYDEAQQRSDDFTITCRWRYFMGGRLARRKRRFCLAHSYPGVSKTKGHSNF